MCCITSIAIAVSVSVAVRRGRQSERENGHLVRGDHDNDADGHDDSRPVVVNILSYLASLVLGWAQLAASPEEEVGRVHQRVLQSHTHTLTSACLLTKQFVSLCVWKESRNLSSSQR